MENITTRRIRELCKAHNITVAKLERACDFSNGYITKSRVGAIPADKLLAISEYFQVDMAYLMGLESNIFTKPLAETVGDRIRALMKKRHYNNAEVCAGVGIPLNKLQDMLDGKDRNFDITLMVKFCNFFDVNYKYFVEDVNDGADVGKNIKTIMNVTGDTVQAVASGTGLSVRTINSAIANDNTVKFSELEKIAEFFGYDFASLICRDYSANLTPDNISKIRMHRFSTIWLDGKNKHCTVEQMREIADFASFILSKNK